MYTLPIPSILIMRLLFTRLIGRDYKISAYYTNRNICSSWSHCSMLVYAKQVIGPFTLCLTTTKPTCMTTTSLVKNNLNLSEYMLSVN